MWLCRIDEGECEELKLAAGSISYLLTLYARVMLYIYVCVCYRIYYCYCCVNSLFIWVSSRCCVATAGVHWKREGRLLWMDEYLTRQWGVKQWATYLSKWTRYYVGEGVEKLKHRVIHTQLHYTCSISKLVNIQYYINSYTGCT